MITSHFEHRGNILLTLTVMVLLLSFVFPGAVMAQVRKDSVSAALGAPATMSGKFRAEASFLGGFGFKNLKVGVTDKNADVTISGGGGFGGSLGLTYGLSSVWDINVMVGLQDSPLQPDVENASGKFIRVLMLATLKYGIPITTEGTLKFGAGAGYYAPGDLDLDLAKVSNGSHNIYSYDGSVGFHVTADYDWVISEDFTWGFGLKFYSVSYNLNKIKSDNIVVPQSLLTGSDKDDLIKLKGSGIDFTAFFAINL